MKTREEKTPDALAPEELPTGREEVARLGRTLWGERACNIPTGVPTLWATDTGMEESSLSLVEKAPADCAGENPQAGGMPADKGIVDTSTGVRVTVLHD